MMHNIDYEMIGKAIAGYRSLGYEYLESEWWVSKAAQYTTMPSHIMSYVIDEYLHDGSFEEPVGHLVGSSEQSLIQKVLDKRIAPGLYVMAGPCFRNEPYVDEFHHRSFFKVELACVYLEGTLPSRDVQNIIRDAQLVHRNVGGIVPKVVSIPNVQGYDLEVNGIEVGSYGQRSLNGIGWIYGTGIALPRFTQAISKKEMTVNGNFTQ